MARSPRSAPKPKDEFEGPSNRPDPIDRLMPGLTKYDNPEANRSGGEENKVYKPAQRGSEAPLQQGQPQTANTAEDDEAGALGSASSRGQDKQDQKNKDDLFNESDKDKAGKKQNIFTRRRTIIGGSIIGTALGIATIIGVGTTTLPALKIINLMANLDSIFGSSLHRDTQTLVDNLMSRYLMKYVLPGVDGGLCKSTIAATCVGPIDCKSPVTCLFKAWRQNHLEQKLANEYHISFVKENGKLYMVSDGTVVLDDPQIRKAMINDDITVYELGDAKSLSTLGRAKDTVKLATQDETYVKRVIDRHYILKLLRDKYGIPNCIIACKLRGAIQESLSDAKQAAKAYTDRLVANAVGPLYAKAMACVLNDANAVCGDTLQKTTNPADNTETTAFQADAEATEASYRTGELLTDEALDQVVAKAQEITEHGLYAVILKDAFTAVFGDAIGKIAGTVSEKFIPIAGWVMLIAQIVHFAKDLGPTLRHFSYAIKAIMVVKMFSEYMTITSEIKSGNMNSAVAGSYFGSLTSNMTGAPTDQSDMTESRYYNYLTGSGTTNTKSYICNDGNPVPAGQLICPEEVLNSGNDIANTVSKIINVIPGIGGLADIINEVGNIINDLISGLFTVWCKIQQIQDLGFDDPCATMQAELGKYAGQLMDWLGRLIISPMMTANMSGGRTFDMLAAGADVSLNKTCQVEMGCAVIPNQQVADDRAEQASEAQAAFDRQPLFARLFSADTPYSLISRVADAMPSRPLITIQSGFASVLSNPFGPISNVFSSVFAHSRAFAAPAVANDPFGVLQYGLTDIPNAPDDYYDQNCQNRDFTAEYENRQTQSADTGEAYATKQEMCMAIKTVSCAAQALIDPSCLPPGSTNPDNGTTGGYQGGAGCSGNQDKKYRALVGAGAGWAGDDQGVDFTTAQVSGYDICAPAPGKIVYYSTTDCFFNRTKGCTQIREQLDRAPAASPSSQYIYYAECITPNPAIGMNSIVKAGDIIGHHSICEDPPPPGDRGIEVGWAGGATGGWLCNGVGTTPCGTSFDDWIQRGAP